MTVSKAGFILAILAAFATADPTSVVCTMGIFGQQTISNDAANTAVGAWMSGVGCTGIGPFPLIYISAGGRISKTTNGVTVAMNIGRAEPVQVSCQNLLANFEAIYSKCSQSLFGGIAYNFGIWDAQIGTQPGIGGIQQARDVRHQAPSALTTIRKDDCSTISTVGVKTPATTPAPSVRQLEERIVSSTTTTITIGGITQNLEYAPTGVLDPHIHVSEETFRDALDTVVGDFTDFGGFGGAMDLVGHTNLLDDYGNIVGSAEIDMSFTVPLGHDLCEETMYETLQIVNNVFFGQGGFMVFVLTIYILDNSIGTLVFYLRDTAVF
ncbi:hypothetical protein V8E54_014865 [Elaphomyces granulatus]|jgi:hypothetical protein